MTRIEHNQPAGHVTTPPTIPQRALGKVADSWLVAVLLLLVVVFTIANPAFLSVPSWLSISVFATSLLLVVVGQTFVIVTGGIDLSVGGILAVSAMAAAAAMRAAGDLPEAWTLALGLGTAILVGVVSGAANALLITKLHFPPFIATLGVMGITTGSTLLLNNGNPIYDIPDALTGFGSAVVGGWLAAPVIVTAVVCALGAVTLRRLRFGRHVYAMGSSPEAARRSGIPGDRVLIAVYVLSGVTAAIAGVLLMGRFGLAHPNFGSDLLLSSIAAVVIGGGSLTGGRGSVEGSLVGGLIISILLTGLILAGATPFWQTVAVGIAILVAVYVDSLRLRLIRR